MTTKLTPADQGILAVTLDDCLAEGLGDDDTVARMAANIGDFGDDAWALAYKFFRAAIAAR